MVFEKKYYKGVPFFWGLLHAENEYHHFKETDSGKYQSKCGISVACINTSENSCFARVYPDLTRIEKSGHICEDCR